MYFDKTPDELVSLITDLVRDSIARMGFKILQGTWLNAEAEDADLSSLLIVGLSVRWARKADHVTGLSAGDQVLCLHGPGLPVTIIGVVVGDITVANSNS